MPPIDEFSKRSLVAFPAGSNGEFDLPPELTRVIRRGEGCRLWMSNGDTMLDFSMGWGSALVGHGRPEVVAAVQQQLSHGANFAYVTEQSLSLAEELIRVSPACDAVRFCASGSEATMYCLRLARAATGKSKILKFEGAYHGSHDVGVISLFPTSPPQYPHGEASCDGVPQESEREVLIAPYNALPATVEILQRHRNELAAVIVEPLQRCLSPEPGFLAGLRQATEHTGVLMIFDEVVTGFRLAYGGAQEYYGVVPDLVAYGKALGGGMPIGAFGGRRDLMELVEEHRLGRETYAWMASTMGGNPLSAAAGNAALGVYRQEDAYSRLHELGRYLRAGMRNVLRRSDIPAVVLGDGPLAQIAFTRSEVRDYRTCQHEDKQFARAVMLKLFADGVFLNPMGTKLYLSLAHDEAVCDAFCERLGRALQTTQEESLLGAG